MLTDAELLDDTFGSREVGIHFNLAMMTQVNELESDRHLKMSFTEFIDLFGRVADKLELGARVVEEDGGETAPELQAIENEGERTLMEKQGKLATKIEKLFKICMECCLGEEAKKNLIKAKAKSGRK